MLTFSQVSRHFGSKVVLTNITKSFNPGLHLLVGPSGVGKSTFMRIAATIDKPTSGEVAWKGNALPRARKALRQSLGYGPQSTDLPDDLNAVEFLAHMSALKGLSASSAHAMHLLDRLGLARDAHTRLIAWSGGMKRRLVLAQAFMGKPELLILDEPTAELDRETARRVEELVTEAAPTAVVIVSTHITEHFPTGNTFTLSQPVQSA